MTKIFLACWCAAFFLIQSMSAAVFTVTKTAATGSGTLRASLMAAAGTSGADTIIFNIPLTDPNHFYYQDDEFDESLSLVAATTLSNGSIADFDPDYPGAPYAWFQIQSDLDFPLSVPSFVTIDATTQPGYAGKPIVELNGYGIDDGLMMAGSNCVIRGLIINRCGGAAIHIQGAGAVNNSVFGCYLGTDPSGLFGLANGYGVLIDESARINAIGGTTPDTRNLISGNYFSGIEVLDPAALNIIRGNWIGTDVTGTNSLGNDEGIYLTSSNNIIGANIAGSGNVIAGNLYNGISVIGPAATGNLMSGNKIGVDPTGTQGVLGAFVEGTLRGILIAEGADANVIGDGSSGAGNVISVEAGFGIAVEDSSRIIIRGNRIGTDIAGRTAIFQSFENSSGILLINCHQSMIGGLQPGYANVISGNGSDGLVLIDGSSGNSIQGNFIGTDIDGLAALPNYYAGIYCAGSNNVIGGYQQGARNIIAANLAEGIWLADFASSNQVIGNFIGLAADGSTPLGNEEEGVRVGFFESGQVGFAPLIIGPEGGTGNSIRANSIFANGALGIDLGSDDVSLNDPQDSDTGPNRLQNYPAITSVSFNPNRTMVQIIGTLNSVPNRSFEIEFFASPLAHQGGHGEGQHYLGVTSVVTSGAGQASFNVTLAVGPADGNYITATATDAQGNTSEFSAAALFESITAPLIIRQPASTNVAPGTTVTFCVNATGNPTPEYQWRRNGVNISDATNSCLTISQAEPEDGGSYSVVVANSEGTITSDPALLSVDVFGADAGDNFANRGFLFASSGVVGGTNGLATFEAGESNHGGKPGGKSMWYQWTAPEPGTVTFRTTGSSFDTLLAVYLGESLSNLVLRAEDEDSGGFLTSSVRFEAQEGVQYQIAVDGFAGEVGRFVLSWTLEQGLGHFPAIMDHPKSATVGQGTSHTFTVVAEEKGVHYQWLFNGVILAGATNSTLTISNVQPANLGEYVARIHSSNDLSVDSIPASLQLNLTGVEVQPVLSADKFQDATNNPIRLGTPGQGGGGSVIVLGQGGGGLSRGYSGTHTFNTFGSKSQAGEPNHCGVVGGASQWFTYQAEEPGVLFLNTDGSNFDTVLAIYTGSGTSFATLHELACDNNHGLDGTDSSTNAPVVPGTTYFIVVDGVKAATGLLRLNYALVTPSRLSLMGFNAQRQAMLRLIGRAEMKFLLQGSVDFSTWTNLFTGTSPTAAFDFADPSPGTRRFYRAQMLP